MKTRLFSCAVLLFCVSSAYAQDPTVVDAKHYKVIFENDEVRVLRITYGPGEVSVMHNHPDGVAVSLTGSKWLMTLPNGEANEMDIAAGQAVWAPGGPHKPKNVGTKAAEVILVELKDDIDQNDGDSYHDDSDDDDDM